MELFVILTVEKPVAGGGVLQSTSHWVVTPGKPLTRAEVFEWAMSKLPENAQGGSVVCFSAEPNHFPAAATSPADPAGATSC